MKKLIHLIFAAAVIALLPACNKSFDSGQTGKLVIKVTDAPFPIDIIESATVTITKVEIRKGNDTISDGNPFLVLSEDTVTFDLFDLRNGVAEELVDIDIPEGKYNLIRLYIEEASLKIKSGDAYKVKVPSGKQTGIKIFIKPDFYVNGGLTTELLLDFNLAHSFHMTGSMNSPHGINGFIFKPVIRAVNNSTAGRIEGIVSDTSKAILKNAEVWVKQDTIIAESYTDSLGHYAFIGMPAGIYSVFATKTSYDTVSYSGINVIAGNRTIRNFVLTKK